MKTVTSERHSVCLFQVLFLTANPYNIIAPHYTVSGSRVTISPMLKITDIAIFSAHCIIRLNSVNLNWFQLILTRLANTQIYPLTDVAKIYRRGQRLNNNFGLHNMFNCHTCVEYNTIQNIKYISAITCIKYTTIFDDNLKKCSQQ